MQALGPLSVRGYRTLGALHFGAPPSFSFVFLLRFFGRKYRGLNNWSSVVGPTTLNL